jgi:hypothetical protein
MHCAYKERTDTSGSLTNGWMLGMIYSGKIDALAGVITFTSDSFVVLSSCATSYTKSTDHLQKRPESSGANHGGIVT